MWDRWNLRTRTVSLSFLVPLLQNISWQTTPDVQNARDAELRLFWGTDFIKTQPNEGDARWDSQRWEASIPASAGHPTTAGGSGFAGEAHTTGSPSRCPQTTDRRAFGVARSGLLAHTLVSPTKQKYLSSPIFRNFLNIIRCSQSSLFINFIFPDLPTC